MTDPDHDQVTGSFSYWGYWGTNVACSYASNVKQCFFQFYVYERNITVSVELFWVKHLLFEYTHKHIAFLQSLAEKRALKLILNFSACTPRKQVQ